jgi:hypothetical protein
VTDGIPSSPARQSDRLRSYAYDPVAVLGFLGSIFSAIVLAVFIWTNRADSVYPWRAEDTAIWAMLCFGPIAALCWSAIPSSKIAVATYLYVRRLVQLHAVVAACVWVVGCSQLGDTGYFVFRLGPLHGLFAFAALVLDLVVLAFAPLGRSDPDDIKLYRAIQVRIVGGTVAAIAVWSFLHIGMVVAQAEWLAWGRPYCLQVSGDYLGRYKQVNSLLELNGLNMHTPFTSGGGSGTFQFGYHAVLAVDREGGFEWRHWSYAQQHFVRHGNGKNIAGPGGRPACEPRAHFAFQL